MWGTEGIALPLSVLELMALGLKGEELGVMMGVGGSFPSGQWPP